jgi:iron complex transport system ATP-binding protein
LVISDLEDKPIGAMSSGEGRKIVIARALINDPEIFALDEPTTGLDPQAQADFVQFMEEVAKERASTLVLVTHHANEIISAIKRVVGVRYGKILFDGDKKEFLNSKNISDLFGAPFSVLENQQGYYQFVSVKNTIGN